MIIFPPGIYLLKVNNRNTRAWCEICSKLGIKTPERCHWRRSGHFIVIFEHISHLVLCVSIANFEHVIAGWVYCILDLLENYNAFQSNFIEITLRQGCSPVHLLHIFRTPFHKNTSGGLLLLKGIGDMIIVKLCNLAKTLKFHVHKNYGNQT